MKSEKLDIFAPIWVGDVTEPCESEHLSGQESLLALALLALSSIFGQVIAFLSVGFQFVVPNILVVFPQRVIFTTEIVQISFFVLLVKNFHSQFPRGCIIMLCLLTGKKNSDFSVF